MYRLACLALMILILSPPTGTCADIAYAIGANGNGTIENASLSKFNGSEIITFTVSSGPGGSSITGTSERTVESIKEEINKKIDIQNQTIKNEGLELAAKFPGDRNIDQVCSIYDYLKDNWSYVADPRGIDEFRYASDSLLRGKRANYAGAGDCDDFSILMSALIESVGGTTRIILAYGTKGGHAYPEVYMGKVSSDDQSVQRMIDWLKRRYHTDEINYHINETTGDIWLNLDWWREPGGSEHPGGPFFSADKHVPILVRDQYAKAPLKPANVPPVAVLNYSYVPEEPYARDPITFDASKSYDVDKDLDKYIWDFGDKSPKDNRVSVQHSYAKAGAYTVTLTVKDSGGATDVKSTTIDVNEPPLASFSYSPEDPRPGDRITFRAAKKVGENISKWEWDFDDTHTANKSTALHEYMKKGVFDVTLTVTDAKGGKNYSSAKLIVGKPIINMFFVGGSTSGGGPENIVENTGLVWNVSGATKVTIDNGVGDVPPLGGTQVSTTKTTAFTLKAENKLGSVERKIYVNGVDDRAIINSFSANPKEIRIGESTMLSWNTSNSGRVYIAPIGWVTGSSGSISASPTKTTKYSLSAFTGCCLSPAGPKNITVKVVSIEPDIFFFDANPRTINASESTRLSWSVYGATKVIIEPEPGQVPTNGDIDLSPPETTVYRLMASNEDGISEKTITINVRN